MNEILCLLRPTRPAMTDTPTDDEVAAVRAHFRYLQELLARGAVRVAGRTATDDPLGIVVYRAATHDDALALADADPAVRAGVMTAQTFPFRTALIEGAAP